MKTTLLFCLCLPFLLSSALADPPVVNIHMVFVSDSHGNCEFGERINQLMRSVSNAYVHSLSIGGSSPDTWMRSDVRWVSPLGVEDKGYTGDPVPHPRKLGKTKTPYYPDFLLKSFVQNAQAKKLAIINLGTNSINPEVLKKDSAKMVKTVFDHGADCAWISPPNSRRWTNEKTETYRQAIEEAIESVGVGGPSQKKCLLINSGKITEYPADLPRGPQVDGVHYCWHPELIKRAKKWAEDVFPQIKDYFSLN